MAETIWRSGILRAVWHPAGRFPEDTRPRFIRANFDVLTWVPNAGAAPETWIVTRGGDGFTYAAVNEGTLVDDLEISREFGFYAAEPIIIDVHQGDGDGDDWHSLHCFGYV